MIQIGIIGCGSHAQHHSRHYGQTAIVVAAWDPDPEAVHMVTARFKCKTIEELLGHYEVQAVMICSPDQYHLDQIDMALNAGKHVFCEKPLLIPGQPIERLEAAFDLAISKNLIITSCHPRRFDRPFVWLGSKLRSGELFNRFGRVVSFDYDISYHTPSNEWKHDRSLLLDHINHEVDLMNALFGIQGFYAWKLSDGYDHYDAVGRRDDDISFHFKGTRRLNERFYHEWCRVRFERGEVEIDMMNGWARISDHGQKFVEMTSGLSIDYDGRLAGVMENFTNVQIVCGQSGYLSRAEMLMNTECGIVLAEKDGVQRINVRS
jgi:predicted dehydrogenase